MGSYDGPREDGVLTAGGLGAESTLFAITKLFDISPDGIVITDAKGSICGANPRAEELFGYTQDELLSQPIENLIPERFRERHLLDRENYHAAPRTRRMGASPDIFALRKDGTEFPVDIMLKPVETPAGPLTLSFIRDITQQWQAQEALRNADSAIYLLDKDGFVLTWNLGAERIKGYTTDEIVGRSHSQLFTREDIERGKPAELLRLVGQRDRVEQEGWRVRKDGSRFWADIALTAIRDKSGELIGCAAVTRDHTDRKRAEEALLIRLSAALLSNRDLRKLLEAISASLGDLIPHHAASIGLLEAGKDSLAIQFMGVGDAEILKGDLKAAIEGSLAGQAFRQGEPVVLNQIEGSPFDDESARRLARLGMRSACWAPLVNRGEPIGTLMVASRAESAFGPQEVEMLTKIAGHVALAVSNAVAFQRAAESRDKLAQEKKYLEEEINLEHHFEDIVGESTELRQVLKQIETVAPTDATVLIQGETGTGKELLARAIHRLSRRSERSFIKLNCAAIPAGLLESELFGHEKGAFTGAIARKIGRLELAHEGTLFLDEIGELPLELQPKLLRALQDREIERVGGTRSIVVNTRLIAATTRDLAEMVEEKQFRRDLFYRLKVFPIYAPPLRERVSDIPILVRHFVAAHCRRMGKTVDTIPEETMEALTRWSWPGNIRELENLLERAVILTKGSALYVPLAELEEAEAESAENSTLHEAEREHILRVLRESKGQIGGEDGAAEKLGLKRTTLNSKMKKLGIERSDYM